MTTGAQPTGQELDEALARAIRQLIATTIAAASTPGAGGTQDAVSPAA
jgi:hypothetical protein